MKSSTKAIIYIAKLNKLWTKKHIRKNIYHGVKHCRGKGLRVMPDLAGACYVGVSTDDNMVKIII